MKIKTIKNLSATAKWMHFMNMSNQSIGIGIVTQLAPEFVWSPAEMYANAIAK